MHEGRFPITKSVGRVTGVTDITVLGDELNTATRLAPNV